MSSSNCPIPIGPKDETDMDNFFENFPHIMRILLDLDLEKYDRLDEMTEEARLIRQRLGQRAIR